MNSARLLKLADFLWNLPEEKFDYTVIIDDVPGSLLPSLEPNCGARACAIGWAPGAFPDELDWEKVHGVIEVVEKGKLWKSSWPTAMKFFDIGPIEADYLFLSGAALATPDEGATAKEVAEHIRDFVKNGMRMNPVEDSF